MDKSQKLQVGIVGAGVACLAAANALTSAGHGVEVFERSEFNNEIGAVTSFTPNANLILERWGYDFRGTGETTKLQFRTVTADTLDVQYRDSFDDVPAKYEHSFNAFHHVDLHREMRRLAEEEHGAKIQLGSAVKHIDCQAGILTQEDGSNVPKNFIVIADGIKVCSVLLTSR